MKKLVPEFEFTPEERQKVKELARAVGTGEITASLLFARGLDTQEKMQRFLHPSRRNFLSPFLMSGMKEAKELLTQARDEEWRVAIFGDYDADGIGALAILSRAFLMFGIEPYLVVPERSDGYGLSIPAIDKIFDDFLPDLIVTVDCGISCADEVEYIKEQGAYVIVTDHHELPAKLPDCIVVNPKLKDDYPYDNLAGAGVAFKLASALIGEKANGLLDFCAISTLADSVPLLGENRDIVAEGLRLMASNPRPAITALLNKPTDEITAQTVTFTLAPRLNAAGRMGDAASALRLFTSEDEEEIAELGVRLYNYNSERQKYCDELTGEANALLKKKGAFGRMIIVADEHWNAGFVGIAATRIADEYHRPSLLLAKNGDVYRGSARSIEGVSVLDALNACSEYLEGFGGHSQAAGVSVKEENIPLLEKALNEYFSAHYSPDDFAAKIPVVGQPEGDLLTLARELNELEPFGVGNRRPMFIYRAHKLNVTLMKAGGNHLLVKDGKTEFTFFNGLKYKRLLESNMEKTLVFECGINRYRGKETAQGLIRAIVYDGKDCAEADGEIFENNLISCARRSVDSVRAQKLTEEELHAVIKERLAESDYGTCFIASERETLKYFPEITLPAEMFRPMSSGLANALLVSPAEDADLAGYRDIVFLDTPLFFPVFGENQNVVCNASRTGYSRLLRLKAEREALTEIFVEARAHAYEVRGETPFQAAESCNALGFDKEQFMFALAVFSELGFLSLTKEGLFLHKGVKRNLTESAIFDAVLGHTES